MYQLGDGVDALSAVYEVPNTLPVRLDDCYSTCSNAY